MQNGDRQHLKQTANPKSDMWKAVSQPSCKVTVEPSLLKA